MKYGGIVHDDNITDLGFLQLNGSKTGKKQLLANVLKMSPFTLPSARYKSCMNALDRHKKYCRVPSSSYDDLQVSYMIT